MSKKGASTSRLIALKRRLVAVNDFLGRRSVRMAILATMSLVFPELLIEDAGVTAVSQIAAVGVTFLFTAKSQKVQDLGAALVSGGIVGAALFLMQAEFQVDLLTAQLEREEAIRLVEDLVAETDSVEDCLTDQQQDIRHVQSVLTQERDLQEIDLSFQTIFGRFLTSRDMRRANLSASDLVAIIFRDVNLNGALLLRADLHTVGFVNSSLKRANLSNAKLLNVNLRTADLTGASFKGATYDRRTKWPAGFDPERHGATLQKTEHAPTSPCSRRLRRVQEDLDALQ